MNQNSATQKQNPSHAAGPGRIGATVAAEATSEPELQVLALVHQNRAAKQRDIAHAIGLSLGMTNAILKRLAEKGFVTLRRVNARNVHYLVTPTGVDQITRRSYRYLRRTVGHVVRYKQTLTEFCHNRHRAGVRHIILVGESDLAFLVEWCAHKAGLTFEQRPASAGALPGEIILLSEQHPAPQRRADPAAPDVSPPPVHLGDLLAAEG